jgi:SAM-dependent methyltransferase
MNDFLFLMSEIAKGKSAIRSTLNARLKREFLKGKILDLGSGGSDRYSTFISREEASTYELMDIKKGATVNFETDVLPYSSGSYDTVILLNVLEHLYHTQNILREIRRIKKNDGMFIGYVPFLMWYHPDHHDYYRYTHETLALMLEEAGYTDVVIEPIYRGPYTSAFQMIHPTIPVILRLIVFPVCYSIDVVFRKFRQNGAKRYALGYYFKAK